MKLPSGIDIQQQLRSGAVLQCFFMCYPSGLRTKHVNLPVLSPGCAIRVNHNLY